MVTNVKFNLTKNTREEIREEVITKFLEELPGTGKGELASKYYYTVESFNKYTIELHRPAPLNKGFDFVVHIKGICFKKNRRHTDPSHSDIYKALDEVKNNPKYHLVKVELANCFNLNKINLNNLNGIEFTDGDNVLRPISLIILAVKWLFIEQDMTYWNWSGRNMLWNGLKDKGLV